MGRPIRVDEAGGIYPCSTTFGSGVFIVGSMVPRKEKLLVPRSIMRHRDWGQGRNDGLVR
ncbi:hypothetical protein SAMN06265222_102369 [Neorhodopirellula lusitana]|uniref:Uncharacterized protein n=1 Tax=Neorhodopirellula lusitana TaxID=445327 RepID=A0ABY1PUD7_9BACT|nr:hypothetical protein SAMN06265222_102369 [Neorhodopirellula lusitana]